MTKENEIWIPGGNGPQRNRWTASPMSRRQLLIGAGGIGAAAALAACSPGGTSPVAGGSATGTPKLGGNFRVGVSGGSAKDIFDGQNYKGYPSAPRLLTAFETLLTRDDNFGLTTDGLAESVETDSATQYTIKLRQGIEFHNGKTMTADDVIYSFQRIGSDVSLRPHGASQTMDIAGIKKLDKYTVRLPLKTPDSTIPETLAAYYFGIVPEGYKAFSGDPSTQAGTGAYKLKSFTPGRESFHERHPNYWRKGQPYFDSVTITDFSDTTSQVNALLGGQIDAMADLPASQVAAIQSRGLQVISSQPGNWVGLAMAVDMAPFDDNRVRQAFRLLIDRQAMLDQVLSGHGELGNDLYGRNDAAYPKDLPQRQRDIDKARSLLKEAGKENLTVDLNTSDFTDGMVAMATVFANQAKDAGVTVNVKNLTADAFYQNSDKFAFQSVWWSPRPYLEQVQLSELSKSTSRETHWPPKSGEGSDFDALHSQALATTDAGQRAQIEHKMQQLEYDQGGYIIPFFPSKFDGCASNLQGLSPAKTALGLNNYGHGFRTIWFA